VSRDVKKFKELEFVEMVHCFSAKLKQSSKNFCGNGTVSVSVEHIKGPFEGLQLIWSQFVCHFEQEQKETGPTFQDINSVYLLLLKWYHLGFCQTYQRPL